MKTDDSILEVCFLIRSYGKGELAMCYIHGVPCRAYSTLRESSRITFPSEIYTLSLHDALPI